MTDKIKGSGGGGGGKARTPVESPNSDGATTTARILDLLCEGPIEGPAIGDSWYKSTYLNETPLMNTDGTYNFEGVTIDARGGTASQTYIPTFDAIESPTLVNTIVTQETPVVRTVSDVEVDDVIVTLSFPTMMNQTDEGDLLTTTVAFKIEIAPDGGVYSIVHDTSVTRKHTQEYRKQYRILDLLSYGAGPWNIKVTRITADSESVKLNDEMYWYNYISKKNDRLNYPDSCYTGMTINAREFGSQVPSRAWKIKGRQIKIPSNYDPITKTYTGIWNGNFTTAYTDNPAWVIYDLLTNTRFGLTLDETTVDKWSLYTIGQFCDEEVDYNVRTRQGDGSYSSQELKQPRFTMNICVASAEEALTAVKTFCGACNCYPIWTQGMIAFVQDKPTTVSRIASASNVIDGMFSYEGTPRLNRSTVVEVSWNNPDDMCRQNITVVEDVEGIDRYGYNTEQLTAVGCNNESEAIRKARYVLDTNMNATETVVFQGGLEWGDCLPGEVIQIQDQHYANKRLSGRIKSATTTSITIDSAITIESGKTYTLLLPYKGEVNVHEVTLTNSPGSTTVLTWSGPIEAKITDMVWAVIVSDLSTRKVRVINNKELGPITFEITAITYDGDKYARVEDGVVIETPPLTSLPLGSLEPPTNITITPYTYLMGEKGARAYGMMIDWDESTDPRKTHYELRYAFNNGGYTSLGTSLDSVYDFKDVRAGTYDIGVRTAGVTGKSVWVTYNDYVMITTTGGLEPPTNLQVKGGGTEWGGPDMEIEWTTTEHMTYNDSEVGDSNIKGYKVEIRKTDDTLLRTATTGKYEGFYTYTFANNNSDNNGSPQRALKVNVYTIDIYDNLSNECATGVFTNEPPDMSAATPTTQAGPTYIQISWDHPSDLDLSHYVIKMNTYSPPATVVANVSYPETHKEIFGLDYGSTYYFQVVPYDLFGEGIGTYIANDTPNLIPQESVDIELQASIIITDEDSTADLSSLYDGVWDSGGITYSGGWKWIEYDLGVENFINGVQIWVASATNVCVAISTDGETWEYFGGNASNGLTLDNGQYRLTSRSDLATAKTNYWATELGYNYAFLPNGMIARKCRLYVNATSSKTIYELVFRRIVIAEDIATESLSAITANIGNITAGALQSSDYSETTGVKLDLDNSYFRGRILFYSNSEGYDNLIDKPATLSDINSTEGSKLTGIDTGATNNSSWNHPNNTSLIDGGKISAGSALLLNDGGFARFGRNVQIDTNGAHGSIVVSKTATILENKLDYSAVDYAHLTDGDLKIYYYNGSGHTLYNSLTRVESGSANNGDTVNIPGIWRSAPKITVFPNNITIYNSSYNSQSQKLVYQATAITKGTSQGGKYAYSFVPKATLEVADNTLGYNPNQVTDLHDNWDNIQASSIAMPTNTRRVVASITSNAWYYREYTTQYWYPGGKEPSNKLTTNERWANASSWDVRLYYYTNGAWAYKTTRVNKSFDTSHATETATTLDTGTLSTNITHIFVYFSYLSKYDIDHNNYWLYCSSTTDTLDKYSTVHSPNPRYAIRKRISLLNYTAYLTGATVLANGSVSWLAIGV